MRFAVLGTGRMGARRAALLNAHPAVEDVLLAGGDAARTRAVAVECGARAATVEAALGARPDGVVVASATAAHPEQLAITGREVASVFATGTIRAHDYLRAHGDADVTAAVLTMDDGLPVLVDGSRHDPRGYDVRLEVLGAADAVAVGLSARTPLRLLETPAAAVGAEPGWSSFTERFAGAFAAETEAFVAFVRDGGASPCPPSAALEALRIAVACDRSRAEGRPVALSEVPA